MTPIQKDIIKQMQIFPVFRKTLSTDLLIQIPLFKLKTHPQNVGLQVKQLSSNIALIYASLLFIPCSFLLSLWLSRNYQSI